MVSKVVLSLLIPVTLSISKHPILIIVSYDAFRYDFLDPKIVPNMYKLRNMGSYSDYMINVFPTKTFPNHYSIATGLYPEVHGVIGNNYYDPIKKKLVHMGNEMFHYNEDVIPIWRWNEDYGDERYSGVMMWPGGSFTYQGKNVTYSKNWEPSYNWNQRVDDVISWILDPKKPANLILLYFEEPDSHLHAFGTDPVMLKKILRRLDNITYYLEQQLKCNNLSNKVNVVHLSDHGIMGVSPPNFINVTQNLRPHTYMYAGTTPILQFVPEKGFEEEVYEKLKAASVHNKHFKVYKKDEYLERWHYKNNARSPPILVVGDAGYGLDDLIASAPKYAETYNFTLTNFSSFGVHGYDYTEKTMRPFFMARGPKIRSNHKVKPFNTVDLFSFFCELLEILSTENNGTFENIKDILAFKDNINTYSLAANSLVVGRGLMITITIVAIFVAISVYIIKRQKNTTTAALSKRFPQNFHTTFELEHLLEAEDA